MARPRLPAVKARDEWHKNDRECWSLSLGERGYRVRVTQRGPGGVFARITWIPGRGESRASLHTDCRPEARRRAERFLRALLLESDAPAPRSPLTLGQLLTRYQEAPTYKATTKRTQDEYAARAKRLLVFFPVTFRVERLSLADIDRYAQVRRRGTGWPDGRITPAVRARSIAYDLQVLRAAIRWACTVREPDGEWLLQENPLRGLKLPREANPRRPVATNKRFLAVRCAAQELAASSATNRDRARWLRLELALVLAEGTGRRIGAIAGLQWADIATDPAAITWRAAFDKRRREQTIPIPVSLAEELRSFRAKLGAFDDGWLFPQSTKHAPWNRKTFDELLRRAEKNAGIKKLMGGLWHPYRRAWATARKHLPTVDVMKAGGWADRVTMETCYQQATDAGMLAVMASPLKLIEKVSRHP